MEKTATTYMFEAFFILKKKISYVLISVFLTSAYYFSPLVDEDLRHLFFLTTVIPLLIIIPLFYGQFIEIINNGHQDRWINVFNNYWMKVFCVRLILLAPTLPFIFFSSDLQTVKEIISFLIEVASIYILPLVLLKKEIISSFKLGFKCLIENFKFNLPIILILFFLIFFPNLINIIIVQINIQFISYTYWVILIFLSTFVEFTIFIAASLVLKEKVLITYHEGN